MRQIILTAMLGVAIALVNPLSAVAQTGSPAAKQQKPESGSDATMPQRRGDGAERKGGRGENGKWQGRRKGGGPPKGGPQAQGGKPGGAPGQPSAQGKRRGGAPGGRRGGGRGGRPTFVTLDSVIKGPLAETVPIFGRLVARQMGDVAARVRGPVAQIRGFVGDRVKKGDVLVQLATDMLEAQRELQAAELQEFQARVKSASAQVNLVQQALKRYERLRRSPAFSQARFDDKSQELVRYRSVRAETRAKAKQARAELRKADIDLRNATIRAPFAGTISQRHTDVGAYLNVGARVVTLINDTALEVEAEVPSARLKGLRPGSVVRTEFENGSAFMSTVRAIVPLENPLARTRTVRFAASFDRNGADIAVNQSVRLLIPVGAPRDVVSVHKDAILQRGGRSVVYIAVEKKAMIRPVQLGDAVGSRFVVLSGLKPGDRVVVRGNERLRPGQTIRERRGGPA